MAEHRVLARKRREKTSSPTGTLLSSTDTNAALQPPAADDHRDRTDPLDASTRHSFSKLPLLEGTRRTAKATTDVAVQPKLMLSAPGDPLEEEADALAEEIASAPSLDPAAKPRAVARRASGALLSASGRPSLDDASSATVHSAVEGDSGRPLDEGTRARMEPHFGHSFASVRVHTGPTAAASASLIRARAYTVGNDIVFGAGQFQTETPEGQRLLAHELTHVVQQRGQSNDSVEQRSIQRAPDAPPATSAAPPATSAVPPAPASGLPPNMGGTTTPGQGVSARSVRVTVTTGPDPEYSSNSRNTGSGAIVLSANPEETYASLRALGVADMWNMACVVGNLATWCATAPDVAPDASPGGSDRVQIANANPADTNYDENYRGAFPHFKKHVQTFYQRFKDFQKDFKENGTSATLGLVKESRARTKKTLQDLGINADVKTERGPMGSEPTTTYTSDSAKNKELSETATELAKKQEKLETLVKKREDLHGIIHWATTSQETIAKEEDDLDKQITEARAAWQEDKAKARGKFPILSYFESTDQLKMLSNPAATAHHIGSQLHEILTNIDELEEKLTASNERILSLPEHLDRLKDTFHLNEFERHTVNYMRQRYTGDLETGQRVATLIAIVLAAIAAAPTGGASLVIAAAAIGEAAINTAMLLQAYDQYAFEKAASGSNEEKAETLSQDDPSLFWLAFQFVTTVAGLGANAKVVMTELKVAYNEVKAAYKLAATTGETSQLESTLARNKMPKSASEGIVAKALKESVAVLEGIAKGGPEGLQAALDLLKGSPNFYGVRLAVWRLKAGANIAQATQNLQAARQQIINKIVEDNKGKYPKATFAVVDQGFEKPIVVKIGTAPEAATPPPPSPPPSSAPPSSTGAPPSVPSSALPPAPSSAAGGGTATSKGADSQPLPPGVTGPPTKLPDKGILVQTKPSNAPATPPPAAPEANPLGASVAPPAPSPLAGSAAPPAGPAPAGPAAAPAGGSQGGTYVPSGTSAPPSAPPAVLANFHPPMELPDGVKQALAASEELRSAPQAAFGGASAAAGADATIQLGDAAAPFGPMSLEQAGYYAARGLQVPEYGGLYLTANSGRFAPDADMSAKFLGKGSSGKLILRDTSNPNQLYMFKPAGAEALVSEAYVVQPGTYFVRGRAAYDIALDLPTISSDVVPMAVVVYEGRVGSLQPFVKNSENLADLSKGIANNPNITPDMAKQMFKEIWETNPQFARFRENIRAYDHIINNPDRNLGNFLVELNEDLSVKRFLAIDQDLALTPGARTIQHPGKEYIPHGAPTPYANMPSGLEQQYLGKISKTMYDEMLLMRVNAESVKESLKKIYGLSDAAADGVITRLDEVLRDYNMRLKTMKPEDVFAAD